jgi:acetoacetyl-CoA synthetase
MGHYMTWLAENRGLAFDSYAQLWAWSVTDLAGFWASIWHFFEVQAQTPYQDVLASPTMPGAVWFPGAHLNYAEHALRSTGDRVLVVSVSQTRNTIELSADELRDQVARVRAGLVRLGVGRGDRVAAYLPNVAEAVVAFLATASLGAIWSSCAPEFGTRSVVDRFRQIEPVVLLTIDGYRNGSTAIDRTADVAAIRSALPSLRSTVVLPYLDQDPSRIPGALPWAELVATNGDLVFEPVPFDHPLYILYSSGTTGLPKPIVHGHGGMLLEHLKALGLHHDLGERDRFFWFSSTGWMMWNYLVSGLAVGASIVCFDGNPTHPDLSALWQFAAETRVTYFGAGAPFFVACQRDGLNPGRQFDLSRLRGVGSTASPLPPGAFRWVYDAVGPHVHLASMSGGTDVCTALVGGSPLVPVRAGEISCRYLGAKVEAYDPAGRPVIGTQGELVVTAPMPSMPIGFWRDDDGSRHREAYFDKYPGVWCHGDWITISETGTCVISGRSDATLNRGGVRVGTAEVYSVVESFAEVSDSLIVHVEGTSDGDLGELLLFVVPAQGIEVDDALRVKINAELLRQLSPGHVPDRIEAVAGIPRTMSGKKLEVPVKRLLQGAAPETVASWDATANPEALNAFAALARTRVPEGPALTPLAGQPQPEIVESMARIWARVLGLDRVAPHDDFFALGGTSLRAARLLRAVETELGEKVPLASIFQGSTTVAGMASVIEASRDNQGSSRLIVPIRSRGSAPILFFVYPNESTMATLRHFVGPLGPDQEVLSLLPELRGRRFDRTRGVEDLAAPMLETICRTQPRGPYLLAGYSFAGLIAYEIAGRLQADGEEVAWLGILDTAFGPALYQRELWPHSPRGFLTRLLQIGPLGAARVAKNLARRWVRAPLVRLHRLSPVGDDFDYRGAVLLASRYASCGHEVSMDLFTSAEVVDAAGSPTIGWESVHRGPIALHAIPGNHVSILTEPNVRVVAETLSASVRRALAAGGARAS